MPVRIKMKLSDPRKPPAMVISSLEAKLVLNSCIVAAISRAKVIDNMNDVFELTAFWRKETELSIESLD